MKNVKCKIQIARMHLKQNVNEFCILNFAYVIIIKKR